MARNDAARGAAHGDDDRGTGAATGAAAAPAARRIEALDFVRGVALCGILLMNITGFGLPDAYTNPVNAGGATGANLWAWIVTEIGFEGTQRALFSMLFGASVILLTSRLEAAGRADAADIYFRRNLWLVGFGMVNAFVFLWYGDILYAYGIIALFVFAVPQAWRAKWLLAIGVAALLARRGLERLRHARGCSTSTRPMPAAVAARDAAPDADRGAAGARSPPGRRRARSSSRRPRRSPTTIAGAHAAAMGPPSGA